MTKKRCAVAALVGAFLMWGLLGCDDTPGPQGPPGESGTATCLGCHGDTPGGSTVNISAISAEYETSVHATGETFVRRDGECSGCHSNEGFIQRLDTGAFPTAVQSHTSRIDCWTCHAPHTNGNFTTRTDAPVTLVAGGGAVDYGVGNLCANCHQARIASPPVPTGTDSTKLSSRWGPHHSPVANVLSGKGGFFSTAHPAVNSGHSTETTIRAEGCVLCHMHTPPSGGMAGGHSWKMTWDNHGTETDFVEACKSCHPSATDFDLDGEQTATVALFDSVGARLLAAGLIDSSNLLITSHYYKRAEAAAVWNYLTVLEDKSEGVHNTKYVQAMLLSALDFVPAPAAPPTVAKR
jgi:hypothetical protein